MKKYICFCIIAFTTIFADGCKETPPEPPKPTTLSLTPEDASCTEAWLKFSTTENPTTVRLLRDGQRISDLRLLTADSLVVSEGLLPKHTYAFQLQKLAADSNVIETSTRVQVTTMDTSSHSFQFRLDTLGVTSSALYDVAIINDTLAYAVGEMYLRDSTGQIDANAWNAAKWNGQQWELKRIPFIGPCSAVLYPPLKAIWALSATNILMTNGGSIVRYDGANATMDCRMNVLLAGAINKIWASTLQDIYAVGNVGTIVHYDGATWQRAGGGTITDVQDILGSAASNYALAAVSNVAALGDLKILKVSSSRQVDQIPWNTGRRVHSIWYNNEKKIFASGGGVFVRYVDQRWREQTSVPLIYTRRVRGITPQDVFVAGDFGLVAHFNGMNWRVFPEVGAGLYYSCDYRPNRMIAVGERSGRAVALRMWR